MSKKAFDALPKDVQSIVKCVAASANIIAHTSAEALNGDALTDLVENHGVKHSPLPSDVVAALKKKTAEVLADGASNDATTKKVHESFMNFKKKHDAWKGLSEAGFLKAVTG